VVDARAKERGLDRSGLVRSLALDARPPAKEGRLAEADLVALLEDHARAGSVRACELLLKRLKEAPEQEAPSPFSEADEFARRRAAAG
jgi:hypothetical protein